MKGSPQLQWKQCLEIIRNNVSEQLYNTWFEPIKCLSFQNKTLTIQVPSQYVYEFLEEHYVGLLRSVLNRVFGTGTRLMYRIDADKTNNLTVDLEATTRSVNVGTPKAVGREANKAPAPLQAPMPQDLDSQLNPNYNFENFIKGTSNEFSRTVAETVAQNPARTFNPLFLYGPSGVGKTHLINAIGTRIKELYPEKRVLYVSAHLFQVQYTDSVRTNHFNDFISFYQTIDVLIIDDIQEFAGMTKTQNTFFHIFNHLHQNGKQLILTSDRAPVMLQGMEVNSLLVYSIQLKREINLELAQHIVQKAVRCAEVKPLTVNDIIEKVCKHYQIDTSAIHTKTRKREVVQVRQLAMYLAKKHTDVSSGKIGQMIGNKDHATVLHACKIIKDQVEVDKAFKSEVEEIEASLHR